MRGRGPRLVGIVLLPFQGEMAGRRARLCSALCYHFLLLVKRPTGDGVTLENKSPEDPLWIPLEFEHKLEGSSGDPL